VLKISMMKLHLIEDPEARLRRSVLINNTFRTLQLEHREAVKQEQLERLRRKRSIDSVTISPVDQTQTKRLFLNDNSTTTENVGTEDILSDVILPPPLNPNHNHVVVENYKVINCYEGDEKSPQPPWMEKEYFDWAQISEEEQKIWQDDDEDDSDIELTTTVQNCLSSDAQNEDEGYEDFSDSSSEEESTEYDPDLVVEEGGLDTEQKGDVIICRLDSVMDTSSSSQNSLLPSLMAPLES